MDKVRKSKERLLAVEMLAVTPNLTQKDLAESLGVTTPTVRTWLSDPLFIDVLYKRFMEVAGKELPFVISAMIREAKAGNVQAGRLVLEHFGKLEHKIKIQVESPFEKFMKMEDVENAEFVEDEEITNGAVSIAEQASALVVDDIPLPDRDISNDKPKLRERGELKMLKFATQSEKKKVTDRELQQNMYERRKRAKAVGLKLLPPGRTTKSKRDAWWDELEKLEIEKFREILSERF